MLRAGADQCKSAQPNPRGAPHALRRNHPEGNSVHVVPTSLVRANRLREPCGLFLQPGYGGASMARCDTQPAPAPQPSCHFPALQSYRRSARLRMLASSRLRTCVDIIVVRKPACRRRSWVRARLISPACLGGYVQLLEPPMIIADTPARSRQASAAEKRSTRWGRPATRRRRRR